MNTGMHLALVAAALLFAPATVLAAVTLHTLAQPLVLYSLGIDLDTHFYDIDLNPVF